MVDMTGWNGVPGKAVTIWAVAGSVGRAGADASKLEGASCV